METNTKKSTRDIVTIKNDISRLQALIIKREQWLNDPANRRRNTWIAVHKDTLQLIDQLQELEEELQYASNH